MKLAIVLLCVIAHATLVLGNPDDMGPGDSPVGGGDPSGEAFKSGVTTSLIEKAETDEGLDEIEEVNEDENGGDEVQCCRLRARSLLFSKKCKDCSGSDYVICSDPATPIQCDNGYCANTQSECDVVESDPWASDSGGGDGTAEETPGGGPAAGF